MKAKTIMPSFDRFRRLLYLTGNLPSVITDSKAFNQWILIYNYTMHYHLHTQTHKVNIFFKGTHLHAQAHIFLERNYLYGNISSVQEQESNQPITYCGLTRLSFFRYRSYGFWSLSTYFLINFYRFRNYRNIGAVFVSDNIASILFSRKKCKSESDLASYRFRP